MSKLLGILTSFILAYVIIMLFFSGERKFENLALGTQTTSYQAMDSTKKMIHLIKLDGVEDEEVLTAWKQRGSKKVILVLGNSQTHSINQIKDRQVNFVQLLFQRIKQYDVLCHSLPNASLQEMFLAYQYWNERLPIHAIIVPAFMDDMREDGIRDVYFPKLVSTRYSIKDTSDYLSRKINSELRSFWTSKQQANNAITQQKPVLEENRTLQEETEEYLTNLLNKQSVIWNNRPNVRGEFFNWLYKLRNTVLRINAETVRKMIPSRYSANMHALQLLAADASKANIKLLVYIPPIRHDVKLPYNASEYGAFKNEIKEEVAKYPSIACFKNFEMIVPPNLWGYKESTNLLNDREVDFMHFQYQGHQIMADSLGHMLTHCLK